MSDAADLPGSGPADGAASLIPARSGKKSGLWLWIVLGVLAMGILAVGFASDRKKSDSGAPEVAPGAEDYLPGGKRPSPWGSSKTATPSNPAPPAPPAAPMPDPPPQSPAMTDAEKLAFVRQRAPLLAGSGSGRGGSRAPSVPPDDGLVRNEYGAVVGVRPQVRAAEAPGSRAGAASRDEAFFDRTTSRGTRLVQVTPARDMSYRVNEGKLISAVLETAIQSDLPCRVRALLDEDVYGEHGRNVLMPRMTRLVGECNSNLRQGQSRVYVVWRRALLPDGSSIDLASPGTDGLGRGGLAGHVNRHFFQRFGSAILLSIIGGTAASLNTGNEDTAVSLYRLELARGLQRQSAEILGSELRIPPTIHVPQGERIKVFVAQDLDFSPAGEPAGNADASTGPAEDDEDAAS